MPYETSMVLDPNALINPPSGRTYCTWHAQPTADGSIPAGCFSLRSGNGRSVADFTSGVSPCWATSEIGWEHTSGVRGERPRRIFSKTRAKLPPQPAPINGKPWKRAFWMQLCVFVGDEPIRVIWETAQEASWKAYVDLMLHFAPEAPSQLPRLPLIAYVGHSAIMVPQFKVLSYIDRPACLPMEPEDCPSDSDSGAGNGEYRSRSGPSWDDPNPNADDILF